MAQRYVDKQAEKATTEFIEEQKEDSKTAEISHAASASLKPADPKPELCPEHGKPLEFVDV